MNFNGFLLSSKERFPIAEFRTRRVFIKISNVKLMTKRYENLRLSFDSRYLFRQTLGKNTSHKPKPKITMFPVKQDINICLNNICVLGLQILFHVKPNFLG
jgi:hypothetical protein